MNKIWQVKLINHKLHFDRDKFNNFLLSCQDGNYELVFRKKRKLRSLEQNRAYWGIIIDILSNEFGYSKDECHEAIKMKFLSVKGEANKPDYIRSTTELSTLEFETLCREIREWAYSEYNIIIPEPNQYE
ncbi:MAG: hypothetical protein ACFFHD_15285 [Promethearchaeota archaeon]